MIKKLKAIAGVTLVELLIGIVVSSIMMIETQQSFVSSSYNQGLFSIHGSFVCLGLILYSLGSKAIPAAELTLLSLTEIIGGIFWVWLPLFGINEIPSNNTIIGGFLIFMSIIYYSLTIKTNRRFIKNRLLIFITKITFCQKEWLNSNNPSYNWFLI